MVLVCFFPQCEFSCADQEYPFVKKIFYSYCTDMVFLLYDFSYAVQDYSLGKGFFTVAALVWVFSSMSFHVVVKTALL